MLRAMLSVAGIRKTYGERVAVDGLSFEVRRGETFGLLGPNGAGKSTTLLMLTGLLRPDAGRILLDGGSPTEPAVRRSLGLAPQGLAIYPDLSAEENLAFFGRLYSLPRARLAERVEWALDLAGLPDRRRDRVVTFSGGMQRRLNLACALVHDPQVLLLDEPTVGVDPQSRNHIFEAIERLKKDGRTIVYTSHYMEEVERLCDRIAIIDDGRLLALDDLDALLRAHAGCANLEAVFLKLTGKSLRDA
jgi:ABC-2 type transport system ATP-binding protein